MGDFDNFSSFWKVLQEQLAFDDCRNLMLVLSGMPEIIEKLSSSHESFLRTFSFIELGKMPNDEARMIIEKAISKGVPKKKISQEAIERILFYSENYPHLIQELGYSSFEVSTGEEVSENDVLTGLHGNALYKGSIETLGKLFFSKMYDEIRRNRNYKEVLKVIASLSKDENKWVSRKRMLEKSEVKKTSLGASLSDLVDKGLIIKNPDKSGEYKMYSNMFQVYISKILN